MPGARHVRLYEPCWPFNCAEGIPLFFLEDMQERTAHWCHFGCMAMRLFMSAIAPNSIPSELRCYDSPSGPRFERQSCPTCSEPISLEIIIHGAYSSAYVRSTFRFGGHYSLLPSDHIPPAALRPSFLCDVCRWPFLTYDDFMTRSFIIQDIGGLDALREDALNHSTNYRLLATLDLELAARSQWFPWSEASNRLQFASMDPTLSEDNFGEFLELQPGCDHHTHRGCRTLRLALSNRMNIAALQHLCPVSNCPLVSILSPSPDSPAPTCEQGSTAPPSVTQTPNPCAPGETPAPHLEVNTSVSCCIFLEIDFDLLSFIQRQWTLNRECDLFDSRPAHYSAWYAIAEAGFYGVIPFALPQFMGSFSSIFACGHTMHLGCILSNWFDFCRLHPTYGCRPSDSFSCPMCRAGLNLDVTTYSQYWRIRSSFPGPSSESLLRSHYPRVIFPGRIPEIILLRMFARSSPHQMPHDISHLRSQNALRACPPSSLSSIWGLNYQQFPPTGIFAGDTPSTDITWLIQPLLWEAYFGRQVIRMQLPIHTRREFREIIQNIRIITRSWPDTLNDRLENRLLLEQGFLTNFLQTYASRFPESSECLLSYFRRITQAIRDGLHPHTIPFRDGPLIDLPPDTIPWTRHQAPNFLTG